MKIGTLVKVNIPFKLGEKRVKNEKRYKEGTIIAIYGNFVLVEFKTKEGGAYKECFREKDLIF